MSRLQTNVIYKNGVEKSYISKIIPSGYTFKDLVDTLNVIPSTAYSEDINANIKLETDVSIVHINVLETSSIEFVEISDF